MTEERVQRLERAIRDAVRLIESGRTWHGCDCLRRVVRCPPRPEIEWSDGRGTSARDEGPPDAA